MKAEVDWEDLRERSLNPGGFGKERVKIWPQLLNVTTSEGETKKAPDSSASPDAPPHYDERQIILDTDRSFVLYPVDPRCDREALQSGLHDLLVSLFRRRPRLHYFQGYHDIASVIFLTMPEELHLPCIEQLSLHRLRDSMGTGLEPVLGLLRVTKNLLRLADLGYADLLERNSPLPFYALSNLLTLFSHDVPALPLIQHIFDFLLSRPPIATVYLATAIILSRKQDVLRLEQEGDEGMIHSLLSSFPRISDESDLSTIDPIANSLMQAQSSMDRFSGDGPILTSEDAEHSLPALPSNPAPLESQKREQSPPTLQKESPSHSSGEVDRVTTPMDTFLQLNNEEQTTSKYSLVAGKNNPETNLKFEEPYETAVASPHVFAESSLVSGCINSHDEDSCSSDKAEDKSVPILSSRDEWRSAGNGAAQPIHVKTDDPESDNPELVTHMVDFKSNAEGEDIFAQKSSSRELFLTDLLKNADALYAEFPPSHEGLHLLSIMGPQSVISTWSETFADLPVEEEAEAMVQHLHLIVYPYVEMDEEESSNLGDEKAALTTGLSSRNGKGKGKCQGKPKTRSKAKGLILAYSGMEKQALVAGAVLVVGVTVAIYGIKSRNGSTSNIFRSFADMQGHTSAQVKGWKDVGDWISDTLATMSEKVIHGFSSGL